VRLENVHKLKISVTSSGIDPVAKWLRHYATNRKVAGSITDEVNF
jgi:hypothetical protein